MSSEPMEDSNYRPYVETLLEDWFTRQSEPYTFMMGRRSRPTHDAQFALVYGYCAHAHAAAKGYLAAVDAGLVLAAAPLARMCYQTALTAQWTAQAPEGWRGISNEENRQRAQLAETMTRSVNEVFREGASRVRHADPADRLKNDSDAAARNFMQLCEDLEPGGADAYAIYRAMSMESHPTVFVADQWLDPPSDPDGAPVLLLEPAPRESDGTWMYLVGASLVWSGRALEYFDRDHTRRSFLRRMAREVGCPDTLQLSKKYHDRAAKAAQARRRTESG